MEVADLLLRNASIIGKNNCRRAGAFAARQAACAGKAMALPIVLARV